MVVRKKSPRLLNPRRILIALLSLAMLAYMLVPNIRESIGAQRSKGRPAVDLASTAELVSAAVKYSLDLFHAGEPLILFGKPVGTPDKTCSKAPTRDATVCEVCFQRASGADCASVYPGIVQITEYGDLDRLMKAIAFHYNIGKGKLSPYDDEPVVVVTKKTVKGHVTIHSPDGRSILVRAWNSGGARIFNSLSSP